MSESAEELPGATGDGTPATPASLDEAITIRPVSFDKDFRYKNDEDDEFNLYDFRPTPVDVREVDPKDLSAPGLAASSTSPTETETESSAAQEETVSAGKGSTQNKETKSGQQTSSAKTPAGKTEQTAGKA